MKKIIGVLTATAAIGTMSTLLVGCGDNTSTTETTQTTQTTETTQTTTATQQETVGAVDTNLYNVTEDEVERKTYVDLDVPDGATNVVYNIIDPNGQHPIAEAEFTYSGKEMYIRAQLTDLTYSGANLNELTAILNDDSKVNISGLYFVWDTGVTTMADEYTAFLFSSQTGAGYEAWVNDDGELINVCMSQFVDTSLIEKVSNDVAD